MTTAATSPPPATATELEVLADDECRRLLALATMGRIAFVIDSRPILLPVNYRFLSGDSGLWVLLRTRQGNSIDRAADQVAFEIDGVDHIQKQGWSVLVQGNLHRLDHNEIELLRYQFDPKPWVRQERTSWLAIKPHTVTGRRLHAAEPEWTLPSEAYL